MTDAQQRALHVQRIADAVVVAAVAGEEAYFRAIICGGDPEAEARAAVDSVLERELIAVEQLRQLEQ